MKKIKKMAVFGDSVLWSPGLRPNEKMHILAFERINGYAPTRTRGKTPDDEDGFSEIIYKARSGAPVWQDSPAWRGIPAETRDPAVPVLLPTNRNEPLWRAIPWSEPSSWEQMDKTPIDDDVDLVLLNGVINDMGDGVVTNFIFPGASLNKLQKMTQIAVQRDLSAAIFKARGRFRNARIMVLGYFPITSDETKTFDIIKEFSTILHRVGLVLPLVPGFPTIPFPLDLVAWIVATQILADDMRRAAAKRSAYWHLIQLYYQRVAVREANARDIGKSWQDPINPTVRFGGPGVYFVHPGFGPKDSVGATTPKLFGLAKNPAPPKFEDFGDMVAWARSIITDPRFDDRLRATRAYRDLVDEGVQFKTLISPMGHLNRLGAQQYARVIHREWNNSVDLSVRYHTRRLLGGTSPLSLRKALTRYNLANSNRNLSFRYAVQDCHIDCISVEIETKDIEGPAHELLISLRLSPSLTFLLTTPHVDPLIPKPGVFSKVVIDPVYGDLKRRMYLGDVTELTLIVRHIVVGGGGLTIEPAKWKPGVLSFEINGRELFRENVDTWIEPSTSWTSTKYPSFK